MSAAEDRDDVKPAKEVQVAEAANAPVQAPVLTTAPAARITVATEPPPSSPLARVQAAAGQIVPRLQYQLMRLGIAGQAGLAALTAALAVAIGALLPAYHALQTLGADLTRAQHPIAASSLEQAVPRLVASLPTRAQIPAVLGQVVAEAQTAGVTLTTGRYSFTPAKAGSIAHYEMEFPVKANYPEIRTFINRTLTAVPAAALDKLHVERKAVADQVVNADIQFVVFVRAGDTP